MTFHNALTIFGFVAVFAMMIFDTLEDRHPLWSLGFAISCLAAALYAVLTHSWPFAMVEGFWGVLKVRHYLIKRRNHNDHT